MSFFTSKPPCLMSFCGSQEMTTAERVMDVAASPGVAMIAMVAFVVVGIIILRGVMLRCNRQSKV